MSAATVSRAQPGQALVMAAAILGLLVLLAFGTLSIVTERRIISRVQLVLDQAAFAAQTQVSTRALLAGTPALERTLAESRFRDSLRRGLARLAPGIATPVDAVVRDAELTLSDDGTCALVSEPARVWTTDDPDAGPTVCARVRVGVPTFWGVRELIVDTTTAGTDGARSAPE